jgi:uncharacterized protein (DUF1501 family)
VLSRRDFLSRSTLIALAPTVPAFLARAAIAAPPGRDGRVLVVVQLDGGNDGINTVVPYADEGYARHRKQLRLPRDQLIKLSDRVALHPSLGDAAKLLDGGRLSIVQGVGYPNPSRSHARSMAIWQTARFDAEGHDGPGWLGRALDGAPCPPAAGPVSLSVGMEVPPAALRGRRSVAAAFGGVEDFRLTAEAAAVRALTAGTPADDLAAFIHRSMLEAHTTADRLLDAAGAADTAAAYPATQLAGRLRLVARLIKAGFDARVYYTAQSGYDTHANQLQAHANLLSGFAGAVRAFLDDLAAAGVADRVVVLAFSEFGRQLRENASAGTDHGTAGPVFLAGPGVRAGLAGRAPSLSDLERREPKMAVDFRQVYATVLEGWLGLPSQALEGAFERLPLFRA